MEKLLIEMDEAEVKAWDALARYKFWMFGYWAAIWVHLNRISGLKKPNPWRTLVDMARRNGTKEVRPRMPLFEIVED